VNGQTVQQQKITICSLHGCSNKLDFNEAFKRIGVSIYNSIRSGAGLCALSNVFTEVANNWFSFPHHSVLTPAIHMYIVHDRYNRESVTIVSV